VQDSPEFYFPWSFFQRPLVSLSLKRRSNAAIGPAFEKDAIEDFDLIEVVVFCLEELLALLDGRQ
jgi:hypothetical protein